MALDTCETCQFWKAFDGNPPHGQCRRYPPQREHGHEHSKTALPEIYTAFVVTHSYEYCGEYVKGESK